MKTYNNVVIGVFISSCRASDSSSSCTSSSGGSSITESDCIKIMVSNFTYGLLICTLISENQGLEKLRSVSNLRKISGPAHLYFFSVCHLDFFQIYSINLAFFSRWRPRKKSRFAGPEIFLRFETDLDFSRP